MINRPFDLAPTARDLALQRRDARLQLGDRQAVEVFREQARERVSRTGTENLVEVHAVKR